jgi:cytochrome bd ubiquinol oxidase subunit II
VILSGTYLPLLIMLVALIFSGVAFEFRFKATRNRYWWGRAFHNGSLFATIAQGLVLGTYIQGFEVQSRSFAGGMFDWLSPFSVLTGLALISGYALLGATWLIMKTAGPLQQRCYGLARRLLLAVLAFVGVVSVWTPLLDPAIAARWFGWPNIAYLSPVPLVTAAIAWWHWRSLERGRDVLPFVLAMALFLLSFLGLGISLWPNIVPPDISTTSCACTTSLACASPTPRSCRPGSRATPTPPAS